MRGTSRKPADPRMTVGTIVGMPDDIGLVREAEVIEDRGDLGRNGEQMVRLRYRVTGLDEDFETERPVSSLLPPPTESVLEQLRRIRAPQRAERRKARRAATT